MKKLFLMAAAAAALVLSSCENAGKDGVVIILDETEIELVKGSQKQLHVTVVPSVENPEIEWFSSNPEYVSVTSDGVVKGEMLFYGSANDTEPSAVSVYCRYNGGAAECKVTVTPLPLTSLKLSIEGWTEGSTLKLDPKQQVEVAVTPVPADADVDLDQLRWTTDGFMYATVTPDRLDPKKAVITGVWPGSVEISAVYSRVSASVACVISSINATSVTLDREEKIVLGAGEVHVLSASFLPADATVELEWSSSDKNVATVEDGKVTAVAGGTAVIKVKAGLVEDTVEVEVTPSPAAGPENE